MGPVQILVVRFAHPRYAGEPLGEFARLGTSGIVRLVDVLLVERSDDGHFETLVPPDEFEAQLEAQLSAKPGAIASAVLADSGRGHISDDLSPTADPSWSLADAMPAGSVAAVALIEHVWATRLVATVRRAGGELVEEAWLAQQDREVLERLIEQVDT